MRNGSKLPQEKGNGVAKLVSRKKRRAREKSCETVNRRKGASEKQGKG